MNVFFPFSYIQIMLENITEEGTSTGDPSQEIRDLQSSLDKLIHQFCGFGPVITDLFASWLNFKLKPYLSWGPDPFCTHIEAFTVQWDSPYTYYAYSTFSIIPKVLKKIHQDEATVMPVFPFWSTQMWFTMPTSMRISSIVVLLTDQPIFLPWKLDFQHPLTSKVRPCSAIVSGKVSKQITFLQSLLSSSSRANQNNTKQVLDLNCLSGTSFVR